MAISKTVMYDPDGFRILPDGLYRVRILMFGEGRGRDWDNYVPKFEVLSVVSKMPEHLKRSLVGCTFTDFISVREKVTANSKLGKLIKALTSNSINKAVNITLDTLIGKECIVDLEQHGYVNKVRDYFDATGIGEFANG